MGLKYETDSGTNFSATGYILEDGETIKTIGVNFPVGEIMVAANAYSQKGSSDRYDLSVGKSSEKYPIGSLVVAVNGELVFTKEVSNAVIGVLNLDISSPEYKNASVGVTVKDNLYSEKDSDDRGTNIIAGVKYTF